MLIKKVKGHLFRNISSIHSWDVYCTRLSRVVHWFIHFNFTVNFQQFYNNVLIKINSDQLSLCRTWFKMCFKAAVD